MERNYGFFLTKYAHFIEPIAHTYAYCLLKNHFHILIKTKSEEVILENMKRNVDEVQNLSFGGRTVNVDEVQNLVNVGNVGAEKNATFHISNQFAKLFNSYTQSINKAYSRTGGLFETPFRRIEVKSDAYFSQLVWYIHFNPQKHGFVKDFKDYPHSSYHSHLDAKATKLKREEVIDWYGGVDDFVKYHQTQKGEVEINELIIEF